MNIARIGITFLKESTECEKGNGKLLFVYLIPIDHILLRGCTYSGKE